MCATALCRRWPGPRWAGPRPPQTRSPSSPSTCCLDSLTWVLSVTAVVVATTLPDCTTYRAAFLLQVEEFISRNSLPAWSYFFQYTDAWASCPHLSKYTTSDAESCDISTQPGGWSSLVFHTQLFLKPSARVFVKGEGGESWPSPSPEESWRVRQGWGLTSGLHRTRAVCPNILLAVWCMKSFFLLESM